MLIFKFVKFGSWVRLMRTTLFMIKKVSYLLYDIIYYSIVV